MVVPPVAFFESDGKTPTGVNYELAQAMGKKLGTTITFQQYAFAGLQPALQAGKIDIIFDVLNDTRERQQQFDFVDYLASGNTLLVAGGNPLGVKDLSTLCGRTMSTVRGSVQIKLVESASSQCVASGKGAITINQYPGAAEARTQVQTGRADAFIGNTPVLLYVAKHAENGTAFSAVPLESTGAYYGIALRKDQTQVRDALVGALNQLIADGTYQQILRKYGVEKTAVAKPLVNGATN